MLKQKIFVLSIFLLSTINSQTIEIEKANVNIKRNEIVFKVKGLVCSFCAQGLQKSLSKLKFIDKKKYQKGSGGCGRLELYLRQPECRLHLHVALDCPSSLSLQAAALCPMALV